MLSRNFYIKTGERFMKKIASILIIMTILLALIACSLTDTANNEMYIQKANLTEEEESILEFVM